MLRLGGTSASQSINAIAIDNDFEITSSGTWYTNCLGMTVTGNTTQGVAQLQLPFHLPSHLALQTLLQELW
jgi:hypothetical protein